MIRVLVNVKKGLYNHVIVVSCTRCYRVDTIKPEPDDNEYQTLEKAGWKWYLSSDSWLCPDCSGELRNKILKRRKKENKKGPSKRG